MTNHQWLALIHNWKQCCALPLLTSLSLYSLPKLQMLLTVTLPPLTTGPNPPMGYLLDDPSDLTQCS